MKDIVEIILHSMEPVGVSREDLLSMSREQNIVAAREMVTRMLKVFTCMTDVNVGKVIGRGRNTVYYYNEQFDQRYRNEKNFRAMYETISTNVKNALEKEEEDERNYHCLFCGGDLIWDSDENLDTVSGCEDDDEGIVTFYTCSNCGRFYEIADPQKEDRETTYKEYWNKK